jgi:hypothetical protein
MYTCILLLTSLMFRFVANAAVCKTSSYFCMRLIHTDMHAHICTMHEERVNSIY